jgi:hypothetical protein
LHLLLAMDARRSETAESHGGCRPLQLITADRLPLRASLARSAEPAAGLFGISQIALALVASRHRTFTNPLRDEWYVSSGPWLDWTERDALRLSAVTAGFLRTSACLSWRMWKARRDLRVPALVLLGTLDKLVDNQRVLARFVDGYGGPLRVVQLDFGPRHGQMMEEIRKFVLAHSGPKVRDAA